MQVEARDISVRLPDGNTLFAIKYFLIRSGEHVLVRGPSGSGKTTLLHTLAGLLAPAGGRIRVGDEDVYSRGEGARARWRRRTVGVVFQKLNLVGHLTAAENVALAGRGRSGPLPDDALARVGLAGRANARADVLSLGEQQRVAVARVLAQRPDVLLADEPTSSLDAVNQRFVVEALKDAARGRTLVVASHDERLTPHFDRIVHMAEL